MMVEAAAKAPEVHVKPPTAEASVKPLAFKEVSVVAVRPVKLIPILPETVTVVAAVAVMGATTTAVAAVAVSVSSVVMFKTSTAAIV